MARSVRVLVGLLLLFTGVGCASPGPNASTNSAAADEVTLRVATYNLEDVRGDDLSGSGHPRLQRLAAEIQRARPDILLIQEVAYDQPGAPGYVAAEGSGQNARRFAERYLAVPQEPGLEPLRYRAFMAPTNTGLSSGFDFDGDGRAVTTHPVPPPAGPDGEPGVQTEAGRSYGNDAWGFGTFPGQYGMGLLVREGLEILADSVRTFRLLPWSAMPDAVLPVDPETGRPWYSAEEAAVFRLSSKSHWDVPVRLPNGTVLHLLASHPTPPAFDGPEQRNVRRNRDEIRFWADYLDGAAYVVDDSSRAGGYGSDDPFVILGDLNADPDEGNSLGSPTRSFLFRHPRVDSLFVPRADSAGVQAFPELSTDDTAAWGLRVDYVLPSAELRVLDGGIRRPTGEQADPLPTDHFMVWLDVAVP